MITLGSRNEKLSQLCWADFYFFSYSLQLWFLLACPQTRYLIEEGIHESFSSLFVFWVFLFSAHMFNQGLSLFLLGRPDKDHSVLSIW